VYQKKDSSNTFCQEPRKIQSGDYHHLPVNDLEVWMRAIEFGIDRPGIIRMAYLIDPSVRCDGSILFPIFQI
jgi:hypothetical protein